MAKKTKDGKVDSVREKWLSRIGDEDKAHKSWRDRAKLADEAYCNYNTGIDDNQLAPDFPIFWYLSNLIIGKIYGSSPKPDIRKRHPSSPLGATSAAPTMDQQTSPTPGMLPQGPNPAAMAGGGQPGNPGPSMVPGNGAMQAPSQPTGAVQSSAMPPAQPGALPPMASGGPQL